MQRREGDQIAQVRQNLRRNSLRGVVILAAVDHAMPHGRSVRIVPFFHLIKRRPRSCFVIGNRADLIRDGIAVSGAKPQTALLPSDIFCLAAHEQAFALIAEFV